MKASIITIGDELLIGQVVDTNSTFIGEILNEKGFSVLEKRAIADKKQDIIKHVTEMSQLVDVCVVTGGLGPTKDDITKHTICEIWEDELEYNSEIGDFITNLLQEHGYEVSAEHLSQAEIPTTCKYFINKAGTAPGMALELNGCWFVFLPGVPNEVHSFFKHDVLDWLTSFDVNQVVLHKHILTFNTPESIIARRIESLEESLPEEISLAYLPSFRMVKLRLTAIFDKSNTKMREVLDQKYLELQRLVEDITIINSDRSILDEVTDLLLKHKLTVSTAESCTSGLIASTLTTKSGSSAYFHGGIVAYDNKVKENLLEVKVEDLKKYGAVSQQVVEQMALNVCKTLKTDFSLATSGIAGPTGGSPEKPVGTIWIGMSNGTEVWSECVKFRASRSKNIEQTVTYALVKLLLKIKELYEDV